MITLDSDRPAAASNEATRTSRELRVLAQWYRDYAEMAGSNVIWGYRLSTAEDLERQASDLEHRGSRTLAVEVQ